MPWLLASLRDAPDHILTWTRELDGDMVFKVSLSDRSAELVLADDYGVTEYVIDHSGAVVGRMRLLGGHSGYGWLLLEGRAPGESAWNRITEIHRDELIPLSDFELLGPHGEARPVLRGGQAEKARGRRHDRHPYPRLQDPRDRSGHRPDPQVRHARHGAGPRRQAARRLLLRRRLALRLHRHGRSPGARGDGRAVSRRPCPGGAGPL